MPVPRYEHGPGLDRLGGRFQESELRVDLAGEEAAFDIGRLHPSRGGVSVVSRYRHIRSLEGGRLCELCYEIVTEPI